MAYTPHTWTTGETIDAAKLNANEQGTQAAAAAADTANAGLAGKVNSSTYTAGLAGKADLPAGGTDGQSLVKSGTTTAWATVSAGGTVSDASTTAKGVVQLAGDLSGTAAAPTVAKINGVAPATVATSGSYTDLTNKPTIPAAATNATTTAPGLVQLAGDLGGTAASPTVPGLAGKLTASSNLSDVANAATARTNLGLGTAATSAATAFDASGAATAAQAAAVQRANHTGTQSADTLTDGTTNKAFLATERTKLTGVATGATANSTDAQLRDRSTHTGTQAASTVTGLATVATSGAYADLTGKPATAAAPYPSSLPAGATLANAYDPRTQSYNMGPGALRKFRAKLAASQLPGSTTVCTINCIGDSETGGTGTTTKSVQAWPTRLLLSAAARGRRTYSQRAGFTLATAPTDERLNKASTLGDFQGSTVLRGGQVENITVITGTAASGSAAEQCDGFDVYFLKTTSAASFAWAVDGGSTTTVNTGTSGGTPWGYAKAHIPAGTLGAHTLVLTPVTGDVYVSAISPTVGSSGLQVINTGVASAPTATFLPANWGPLGVNGQIATAPDLTLVYLEINDYSLQTSIATYTSNMQTLIAQYQATGDVVLVVTAPSSDTSQTIKLNAYTQALYGLADSNGLGLIDLCARFGDFATSNALGLYYDGTHPNPTGYQDIGDMIATALGL